MSKELTANQEVRLWKIAWNELEGHLLTGLGGFKKKKARIERDHIYRPMPDDVPDLRAIGSKITTIVHTLGLMREIKTSLYHGRDLTPRQSRELHEAVEGDADGQPVS